MHKHLVPIKTHARARFTSKQNSSDTDSASGSGFGGSKTNVYTFSQNTLDEYTIPTHVLALVIGVPSTASRCGSRPKAVCPSGTKLAFLSSVPLGQMQPRSKLWPRLFFPLVWFRTYPSDPGKLGKCSPKVCKASEMASSFCAPSTKPTSGRSLENKGPRVPRAVLRSFSLKTWKPELED